LAKHWRLVGEIRIAATVGSAGCGGRACGFKSSQRFFSTHGNNNNNNHHQYYYWENQILKKKLLEKSKQMSSSPNQGYRGQNNLPLV
jgi:hypothetical protein